MKSKKKKKSGMSVLLCELVKSWIIVKLSFILAALSVPNVCVHLAVKSLKKPNLVEPLKKITPSGIIVSIYLTLLERNATELKPYTR